ncbi:MAG: hypothetical protein RJA44_649 [Pseudomonadota bacterium]
MTWLPASHAGQDANGQASFSIIDASGQPSQRFPVQFNPASLEYTLSNEFDGQGNAAQARQFVKKTSGKLSMTLLFDTTETGTDVRAVSANIAHLLEPAPDGRRQVAPKVDFSWGTYHFKGVVEQFKETLDFFAPSGVPLRSSINLTLASQEVEFQSNRSPAPPIDHNLPPDPVRTPPGLSPQQAANQSGDARAAREIARQSGADSLRAAARQSLSVGLAMHLPGVAVGAEVNFDPGSSGQAFAGLRRTPPEGPARIDAGTARQQLLAPSQASTGTGFAPGGRAQTPASASLAADVGVGVDLASQLHFGR